MTWQFILPLIIGIFTQIVKLIVDASLHRFSWKNIFSYGGMPSGHSATVTSLCVLVAWYSGIHTPEFTIALTFSFFIIWDALGIRQEVGRHAAVLTKLIQDLPDIQESKYSYLNHKIGHTLPQICIGAFLGGLLTYITLYLI